MRNFILYYQKLKKRVIYIFDIYFNMNRKHFLILLMMIQLNQIMKRLK